MNTTFPPVRAVCVLALLLLPAVVTAAGTGRNYKWVDEAGQIHYGSHPPPGVQTEQISRPPPPPTGASLDGGATASQQFAVKPGAGTTGTPAATGQKTASGQGREDSEATCASARKNLAAIQSRPRTRITEADGRVRFLTPEERQDEIRKAEEIIQQHCQ